MEDITGLDQIHPKIVHKNLKIKNLGEYRDFYLKSNALLFIHVFENLRKMHLYIYEQDPAK